MFAVLEDEEVDGAVGEHAGEAHAETAVVGPEFAIGPHLFGGLGDQSVAVEAAFDGFALHSTADC